MGPGRLRLGSDWLRACHVMSRSRTSMTPLAQRTLRCAAGQCGGRTSMGKRLVPVSGSFRLPVLPSVEWEWEWRAVAAACGPVRAAGHPPSRAAEQSRARARARTLSPRDPLGIDYGSRRARRRRNQASLDWRDYLHGICPDDGKSRLSSWQRMQTACVAMAVWSWARLKKITR